MTEKWKEFPTAPNYYISNLGNVRGPRGPLKVHTYHHPPHYYHFANVGGRNHQLTAFIHRWVGRLFLEGYKDGDFICHKDETLPFPEVHYVDNLYLGDYTTNNRDTVNKCRHNGNKKRDSSGRFVK